MISDHATKTELFLLCSEADRLEGVATRKVVGRRVRIISKTFNGQPYGRSRKTLTGREYYVKSVIFDRARVLLWLNTADFNLRLRLDEVEFIS